MCIHADHPVIQKTHLKRSFVPIQVALAVKNLPASAGVARDVGSTPGSRRFSWRRDRLPTPLFLGFLVAQMVKNLVEVQETWVQSLGREDPPGEANDRPLQYSRLENPMDRGAWWAAVHGVAKSQM